MANNKVVLGNETIIDLTEDTVTPETLLAGVKAHNASGNQITGTATSGGATITVTYTSSFYNKTITCSNGSKTYTKTTTSSGSTEFSVSDEGTWTITCNGVSVSLDVTLNYATQMKPTGSTVTPVNDIQTWLKCGGIFDKTYTTINQVLADTTTLLALISDNNAVDYMVRSTNWANSVCANATAMTDIGANNYCADTLLSDATWASAIVNSTYFESVLNVKVPVMTSNTTPSGVVSASSNYNSNYPAWHAFDTDRSHGWLPSKSSGEWLQYEFTESCKVVAVSIEHRPGAGSDYYTSLIGKIQGSNDGVTFVDISGELSTPTRSTIYNFGIGNDTAYKYYRYVVVSTTPVGAYGYGFNLQFYGRASA